MASSDVLLILQWWGVFFLFSLAFLPVTAIIFSSFFDKGYIFSKTLAVIVVSYTSLVFGTLHLLPFSRGGLIGLLLIIAAINYLGYFFLHHKKRSGGVIAFFSSYAKRFLLEEVLFLLALFFLAYIRSFSPDIHGLEKYMDFGFMNSIARADYFPPKDMWLTPLSINYYYFGHFTGAVLTKLSGIPSFLTYNLILASVFALSFVGSFSLGLNLYHFFLPKDKLLHLKHVIAGFLTALLVTIAGNLHTLYAFFKPYENESPVPLWQLPLQISSFPNSYWYPNATRFIYNTIHEFPIYSWVVADLHGHVFDIPIVITTLAVLLSLLVKSQTTNHKSQINHKKQNINLFGFKDLNLFGSLKFEIWYLPLLSFLIAVMYMTNATDGLVYLLLAGLFLLYIFLTATSDEKSSFSLLWQKKFLLPLSLSVITLLLGFFFFSLPFSLHFKPFVSGIGVLCSPEFLVQKGRLGPFLFEADHCQRSPWWQLLMLYGFFYFFIFSFLTFLTRVKNIRLSDTYVLLLIMVGTFLIIIPEFIYIKDIYPAHYRANTMFKLVFQSFILLSIASSYAIVRILRSMRQRKLALWEKIPSGIFLILTLFLLGLVFIYPFQAIKSYYDNLKTYHGLDGTKYLDLLYPTDYQGIRWLNDHISEQPVLLEAQGDSYTDFARVSANTGLPTVLGWTVHEWLWRNDYDVATQPPDPNEIYAVPAPRIAEIQRLYESPDRKETKRLLSKYKVQYVFLGVLERQKYPALNEEKWSELGTPIFKNGVTTIYKIPR